MKTEYTENSITASREVWHDDAEDYFDEQIHISTDDLSLILTGIQKIVNDFVGECNKHHNRILGNTRPPRYQLEALDSDYKFLAIRADGKVIIQCTEYEKDDEYIIDLRDILDGSELKRQIQKMQDFKDRAKNKFENDAKHYKEIRKQQYETLRKEFEEMS